MRGFLTRTGATLRQLSRRNIQVVSDTRAAQEIKGKARRVYLRTSGVRLRGSNSKTRNQKLGTRNRVSALSFRAQSIERRAPKESPATQGAGAHRDQGNKQRYGY